jgi:hypothetical protein
MRNEEGEESTKVFFGRKRGGKVSRIEEDNFQGGRGGLKGGGRG